jgi:hypothetical protein
MTVYATPVGVDADCLHFSDYPKNGCERAGHAESIDFQAKLPGHFSARAADQPRVFGSYISRRIAALRPHFQPIAGGTYDIEPGSFIYLRDNARTRRRIFM